MTKQLQFEEISSKVTVYLSQAINVLRQSPNQYLKENPQIIENLASWDWMNALQAIEERIIGVYEEFRPQEAIGTFALLWDEESDGGFTIYYSADNNYKEWLDGDEYDFFVDLTDIINPLFAGEQNWVEELRVDIDIYKRLFLGLVELAAIRLTQHEAFIALPKMEPYLILSSLWHDAELCVIYSSNHEDDAWLQIEKLPDPPPVLVHRASDEELILFGESYNFTTKWIRATDMGVGEIPAEVGLLKETEEVILQNNLISKLPDTFFTLRNIRKLDLSRNRFSSLSPEIVKLNQLQLLDLGNNQLQTLPETISGLAHLNTLHLQYNRLKSLPDLGSLQHLTMLGAYHNELTTLPKLPTELEWLNVNGNKLSELPGYFSEMRNLKTLVLSDNAFRSFPKVIIGLQSLESLEIGGNYIEDIPIELKQLPNLRELRVYPNPFTKEKRKALRESFGDILFLGYDTDEKSFMK